MTNLRLFKLFIKFVEINTIAIEYSINIIKTCKIYY